MNGVVVREGALVSSHALSMDDLLSNKPPYDDIGTVVGG